MIPLTLACIMKSEKLAAQYFLFSVFVESYLSLALEIFIHYLFKYCLTSQSMTPLIHIVQNNGVSTADVLNHLKAQLLFLIFWSPLPDSVFQVFCGDW